MKKQKFIFYFKTSVYGKEEVVATKECKRPRQTKIYKSLMEKLERGAIEVCGYKIKESPSFV